MKKLLSTDAGNVTALLARVTAGIVIFPHGAQKLLGLFGGYGFNGTMGYLTGSAGLPWIIALLVILIEFFGAFFLILGLFTRLAALLIIGEFIGVMLTSAMQYGFFMNWAGSQKGEGIEYFLLLFGLAIIALISGGGKASVDAKLSGDKGSNK